jgi:hypothetical protein
LQAGQFGVGIVVDGSDFLFFKHAQTGPGAHAVFCKMSTLVLAGQVLALNTHPHLVSSFRLSKATPLSPPLTPISYNRGNFASALRINTTRVTCPPKSNI